VLLDDPLHDRETDAEPTARAIERAIALREHVEDAPRELARDARAVVAYANEGATAAARRGDVDVTAGIRVAGGVVEEVRDGLHEPRGIAVDGDRVGRLYGHGVAALGDEPLHGVDGALQDVAELHALAAEPDGPAREP
jgi:hypothetical protein